MQEIEKRMKNFCSHIIILVVTLAACISLPEECHAQILRKKQKEGAKKTESVTKLNPDDLVPKAMVQDGEELTEEQVVLERIMLALRTSEGISEDYLKAHADPQELERAFAVGNLTRTEDGRVRIPEKCFFISDSIITDII